MTYYRPRQIRIALGAMILATAAVLGSWAALGSPGETSRPTARALSTFWTGEHPTVRLALAQPVELAVGDPLFVTTSDGLKQVGEVRALVGEGGLLPSRHATVSSAEAMLYPAQVPLGPATQAEYYATPQSMEWVARTLIKPAREQAIRHELEKAMQENGEAVGAALQPIVEASLRDALKLVEQDLPPALARHRPQLVKIGARYQRDIVERELVPLVEREVWPIFRKDAEPTARKVGQEIWDEVSIWRFGWGAAYDRSPLPDRKLTAQEFDRFLSQQAGPVLQAHVDDLVEVIEATVRDTSKNPEVQAAFRRMSEQLIDDVELQRVIATIFREVTIDNPHMREAIAQRWRTPEAQQALRTVSARLEPTVRRIIDMVLGTPTEGISPEFAHVLRYQILAKDRRWILLKPAGEAGKQTADKWPAVIPVVLGGEPRENPFLRPAAPQQ